MSHVFFALMMHIWWEDSMRIITRLFNVQTLQ